MEEVRIKRSIAVPPELLELATILREGGHPLYLVGGAVRDAVLGAVPKDFDVATDAVPFRVKELLQPRGYDLLEVGAAFGVVAVVLPPPVGKLEIATFREDLTAGRHPEVRFASVKEDVQRRDLTINALFYDIEREEVVDLVGGLRDIQSGLVRAVGDPETRFAEDPLRKLRAVRFAARLGYALDLATAAAIQQDPSLRGVSPERTHDEFTRSIACAKSVPRLLRLLEELRLLEQVLPGLRASRHLDVLVSSRGIDTGDPVLALALLLDSEHDHASVAKRLLQLKYSSEEAAQVALLLRFKAFSQEHDVAYHLRKAFRASGLTLDQLSQYFVQRGLPSRATFEAFVRYLSTPPVSGDLLLAQGYSGRALGVELQRRERELFCELLGG